jgi:hypothetical protein
MTRGIRLVVIFLAVLVTSCGHPSTPSTAAPTQPTPIPTQPSTPGTPVPIAPKDNSYVSLRPTFVVLNSSHESGVVLQYGFQIATDPAFANVIAKGSVAEGVDHTSFTPSADLPAMTTIYWRAQALSDATSDLRSGFATGTFVTPFVGPARLTIQYHAAVRLDNDRLGDRRDRDAIGWGVSVSGNESWSQLSVQAGTERLRRRRQHQR